MAPPKTVVAIKTAFLNDQVRILSRHLEFPSDYKEQTSIPSKKLDITMAKINREYSNHIKAALYPVAIRAVADQIDSLYWESGAPYSDAASDGVIRKTDDLTDDKVIANLTEDMGSSDTLRAQIIQLKTLADRRQEVCAKLRKYRVLQSQLEFLKNPSESIQPHLGTRDGPLAQELSKSRALATKLAGRVVGMKRTSDAEIEDERPAKAILLSQQEKVRLVLSSSQG